MESAARGDQLVDFQQSGAANSSYYPVIVLNCVGGLHSSTDTKEAMLFGGCPQEKVGKRSGRGAALPTRDDEQGSQGQQGFSDC